MTKTKIIAGTEILCILLYFVILDVIIKNFFYFFNNENMCVVCNFLTKITIDFFQYFVDLT